MALILLCFAPVHALDSYSLTVDSSSQSYTQTAPVTISGILTDATTGKPTSDALVGITVTNPNGNTAYETIATTASNGTFTTSFTDESGNAQPTGTYTMMAVASYSGVQIATASGNFTVNAATTLDVSELISSSQILNGNGSPQTSFAPGSTAKIQFGLEATTGTPSVVWAITLQQGTLVYNIVNVPANINTSLSTESFSQFIPVSATGTWTATIQVYASNGITPVGVTTLTFTIS